MRVGSDDQWQLIHHEAANLSGYRPKLIIVKTIANLPVQGDGATDEDAIINAVLPRSLGKYRLLSGQYTHCQRLDRRTTWLSHHLATHGRLPSARQASSSRYLDRDESAVTVKLGNARDIGTGRKGDMLFTVSDVLPGCNLVTDPLPHITRLAYFH